MSTYTYQGSNDKDILSTYQIARELPYAVEGVALYGNGGDDNLSANIFGDDRIDQLYGGAGNDYLSANAVSTSWSAAILDGEEGTDTVSLGFAITSSNWEVTELGGLTFRGVTQDGSSIRVSVNMQNEIIRDSTGSYYLVEDLYNGRFRTSTWEEVYKRTYGESRDWFTRGLDTYSAYHGAPRTSTPVLDPVTGGSVDTSSGSGNVYDMTLGKSGQWIKKKKLRRDDDIWDTKGKGKRRKFLVDNDVQEFYGFDVNSDQLSTRGFDLQDAVLWSRPSAFSSGGDGSPSTYMRIGNNIIANFNGITLEDAVSTGFLEV